MARRTDSRTLGPAASAERGSTPAAIGSPASAPVRSSRIHDGSRRDRGAMARVAIVSALSQRSLIDVCRTVPPRSGNALHEAISPNQVATSEDPRCGVLATRGGIHGKIKKTAANDGDGSGRATRFGRRVSTGSRQELRRAGCARTSQKNTDASISRVLEVGAHCSI